MFLLLPLVVVVGAVKDYVLVYYEPPPLWTTAPLCQALPLAGLVEKITKHKQPYLLYRFK